MGCEGLTDIDSLQYPQSWVKVNGQDFIAEYEVWISTIRGAIFVSWAQSPKEDTQGSYLDPAKPPGTPEPLNKLSDYAFLVWQEACNKGSDPNCITGLQWIIHQRVSNDVSNKIISLATGIEENYPGWPGISFSTGDKKGMALLGCPNGYDVAYLVAQHQMTPLGAKTIDKSYVFADQSGRQTFGVNLAYHIVNSGVSRRSGDLDEAESG